MRVDAPARLVLYCNVCRFSHSFLLDESRLDYGPSTEVAMPESLVAQEGCTKRITVATLLVLFSSQEVHGIHELMPPESAR